MTTQAYEEMLSESLPFWNVLSPEDGRLLAENTTLATYAKGESIHHGAECLGGLVVVDGSVRVFLMSEEGKEVTISRLKPKEPCLLGASCVLDSIAFDVFMEAETETECLIIAGPVLERVFENNPRAENVALNILVERFSDIMWTMQQILFMSFDKRLATYLYEESGRAGSDTVKATHEQIAKHLGSAREVVSRMLGYFSREGLVKIGRGTVQVLDRDRLKAIALG